MMLLIKIVFILFIIFLIYVEYFVERKVKKEKMTMKPSDELYKKYGRNLYKQDVVLYECPVCSNRESYYVQPCTESEKIILYCPICKRIVDNE